MKKTNRQNASSLIAHHLGIRAQDVEAGRFQISKIAIPVYFINGLYWCAPTMSSSPPRGWNWRGVEDTNDRGIYYAEQAPERFR